MDPLSVAASIAGLVTLVGKTAQISRELYSSVKKNPELLKRLADELETFQGVLQELETRLADADGDNEEEGGQIKAVSANCESTLRKLQDRLVSLRDMFSKSFVGRLRLRPKFMTMIGEVAEMREDLASFKLTLSIALQVWTIKQSRTSDATANINGLNTAISQARTESILWGAQDFPFLPLSHPIQPYNNFVLTRSSTPPNAADAETVNSFGSFEDWLNSFSPEQPSHSAGKHDEWVAAAPPRPVRTALSKNVRVRLSIGNLSGPTTADNQATPAQVETIELGMTDYFYTGIEELHRRGYRDVCGFRMGTMLLGPLLDSSEFVSVYVTDRPSSYSLDWLEINRDEPLEEFYDSFVRTATGKNALDVSIRNNQLNIRDAFFDTLTTISLNRTLRLPEDGIAYNVPALFDQFPIINVDFLRGSLPAAMVQKSGVVIPMYAREALSIGVGPETYTYRPAGRGTDRPPDQNLAIRVLSGGVNVISGLPADTAINSNKQDYITSPGQRRLDGFLPAREGGRNVLKQFVAMPTGEGYSAEGQVTGAEDINGIQLILAPPFVGRGEFLLDKVIGRSPKVAQEKSPSSLGLEPGKPLRMFGKEIESLCKEDHRFACDRIQLPGRVIDPSTNGTHGSERMRHLRTHEVLRPILERYGHSEPLVLEPVFEMTITLTAGSDDDFDFSYSRTRLVSTRWKLSPFIPMERLYGIVGIEVRDTAVELSCGQYVLPRSGYMLHDVCADGAVITYKSHRLYPEAPAFHSMAPRPQSGWEMGLAPGGKTCHDVYADADPKRWNWKQSRLVNIQMLNAVAFASCTGMTPPEPPFSFTAYVDAGIPFYHVITKSSVLSSEMVSKIETVSKVDMLNGFFKGVSVERLKPVACVVCDEMLADTILRPCNHIFCGECIRLKMQNRNGTLCSACGKPSSHQIPFAGPMEIPQARRGFPSTEVAKSPAPPLTAMAKTRKMNGEMKELVSSVRESAMSAVMDGLAQAISQQMTTGSPKEKELTIASNTLKNSMFRLPDEGKSLLQIAAEQNKTEVVDFLLQTTRPTTADARAAFELAAAAGHLDVVKQLAKPSSSHEAEPADTQAIPGKDALERAAESGKSAVVEYLLRIGHGSWNKTRRSAALHLAVKNGHAEVVQLLLDGGSGPNATVEPPPRSGRSDRGALPNNIPVNEEPMPANLAARKGFTNILRLLHSRRANMDLPSGPSGRRPIHEAAAAGKVDAVRFLAESGVSVTAKTGGLAGYLSVTPLALAAKGNHVEVAKLLIPGAKPEDVNSAAQLAAQYGSADALDFILGFGVDPNMRNTEGWPLLHAAAAAQNSNAHRAIEVLLKHGADITATRRDNDITFEFFWKRPKFAMPAVHKSIKNSNLAVHESIENRNLAVHKSIENRNLAAFEILVAAGADIHTDLEDGRTCLHIAAEHDAVDIGRRLLDEGVDPNHRAQAADHATCLDAAVLSHNLDFTKLLLSRGAVVRDLDLLWQIIVFAPWDRSWVSDREFKCAAAVFPFFQPLLCQVDTAATLAEPKGGATWARKLGDFVVLAFMNSQCEVETALEVFTEVLALSPPSMDCGVVRLLLFHAGRRKVLTMVDSVMRLLPEETCRAVAAGFKHVTSPIWLDLASYIVKRYGSLEQGSDDEGISTINELEFDRGDWRYEPLVKYMATQATRSGGVACEPSYAPLDEHWISY